MATYTEEKKTTLSPLYMPSPEEAAARDYVYKQLQEMITLKNKPMPHFSGPFGERSWLTCIDDSERILNGYTLSREAQGKEDWQSNMMDNVSRAKMRAIAAGLGLSVPGMTFSAVDKNGIRSSTRAEIFKNITQQTFNEGNPTLSAFLQVWHLLSHGVVFEYEGFKTGGAKRKRVVSFDAVTGEFETKEEYVKLDGKPFSLLLNPQEFFWKTFLVRDIQDQPAVAWVQHFNKTELEIEFGKFKNFKYVRDKAHIGRFSSQVESTFYKPWSERVEAVDDYEVLRYYSKEKDCYEVWVNGVPLIRAPLLWGDKEKVYPFAKQISEPYANTNFFVGMPFGQIMEAYQDQKNTIQNTLADKLYRSMELPLLVGLQNKDLFDIEDKLVNKDNRYYVPDVSAVREMPISGINQGELAFLKIIDQNIEASSIGRAQQGMESNTNKTAREVVIADQHARELKGLLYISLEDLWLQKTRLRTQIILTHYLEDKSLREGVNNQIITVKDYSFGDGDRGILDIHIAKSKGALLPLQDIEARELAMEKQGIAYKLVSITKDYLDDWVYDFKIMPQSFHKQDKAMKEDELMGEIQQVSTLFPEFFVANKDIYLKRVLELHDRHPDEYNPPAPPPPAPVPGQEGQPSQPGQPMQPTQPSPDTNSVLGLPQ